MLRKKGSGVLGKGQQVLNFARPNERNDCVLLVVRAGIFNFELRLGSTFYLPGILRVSGPSLSPVSITLDPHPLVGGQCAKFPKRHD